MGNHRFSRLLALCLAVVMVFGSAFTVSAANPSNTKGTSATVTNKGSDGDYFKKRIKVSFTGKNATEYQIRYRLAGSKTWKTVSVKNSKAKSKYITKLKNKGLYDIQVRAKGSNNKWTTAKTISRRFMYTAEKVKLKAKSKAINVTWKKATKISGFEIRYSTEKNMKKAKVLKVSKKSTAKTLKNLKKGKTYYVQVRPYVKKNGKTYWGVYSHLKSVKVK